MHILRNPMSHYFLFIGLYFSLTFAVPVKKLAINSYYLTAHPNHFLVLAFILPVIGIWFAAFYGYSKLVTYADSIRTTVEGKDYARLAAGCGWLAYALPVPALASLVLNSIASSRPSLHPMAVIVGNFVNLLLPLIAFCLLCNGAMGLTTHADIKLDIKRARILIIAFVTLGIIYSYFIFKRFHVVSIGSADNTFFLPAWLMIVSVLVPYLFSWFVGLLAAYEIILFAQHSTGVLYRRALTYLGSGVGVVIVSSIALQYISSLVPRTGTLSLNYSLISIYVIQIFAAAGYALIALGATRLKRIEDI